MGPVLLAHELSPIELGLHIGLAEGAHDGQDGLN
jgi:hypothetical protein